jgi:hypothetical protein
MAERMTRKVAAAFMKEHGISGEPLICDRCGEVLDVMGLSPLQCTRILTRHQNAEGEYFDGCVGRKPQ